MSDSQKPLDSVDEIYTDSAPAVEFVKMQIGFWEKLVVLDAATLAASFTASGIFREHVVGDGGVGYLAVAWKLLFCGIALCIAAQWVAIPGAITISAYYGGMRVLTLLNKLATDVLAQGGQLKPEHRTISAAIVSESPNLRTRAKILSNLASVLGSAGVLTSIAALYWLYRFAHANVAGLKH